MKAVIVTGGDEAVKTAVSYLNAVPDVFCEEVLSND